MREGRTYVALNTHGTPTAAFVHNPDWAIARSPTAKPRSARRSAHANVGAFDAEEAATRLLGDSIYTNPLMLGYAWQKGRIPLSRAALMRAIELNGVQVDNNKAAFEWGRRCAHDLAGRARLVRSGAGDRVRQEAVDRRDGGQARRVPHRLPERRLRRRVQGVRRQGARGRSPAGHDAGSAEAVARYLFKLMAYKDEYEVARLHTDPAFSAKIDAMFEGDYKLVHHLAPPLLAKKNDKGELQKRPFGPWMRSAFTLLAKLKGLRGGPLDVFGRTEERRTERQLIVEYRSMVDELLAGLNAGQPCRWPSRSRASRKRSAATATSRRGTSSPRWPRPAS